MRRSDALNRYSAIIQHIFLQKYQPGDTSVGFHRSDIEVAARELGIRLPRNLGDLIYSFRFRMDFPESIRRCAPEGEEWVIMLRGRGQYAFVLTKLSLITPNLQLAETKIPNATPGIIEKYALTDEQALLAKLRYNRLIDVFTGVTCCSLQSHLRTAVRGLGQIETDELYVGIDRRGVHYVFPVQAKGGSDRLSIVQIDQDFALCAAKFPSMICRPIAAQFIADDVIALFEIEKTDHGYAISVEKHYRLVPPDEVRPSDLEAYRVRST